MPDRERNTMELEKVVSRHPEIHSGDLVFAGTVASPAFKIRRAAKTDVPALIDLAQRSWLSGNCELAPIDAVRDWMEADLETKRYPEIWPDVTVAEHRSRILGLTYADGREVAELWVHPSFQRRSIGSRLL